MSEFCLARQPIFDRRTQVIGYELLYRSNRQATAASVVNPGAATADVLLNAFAELGIDAVVGANAAWVNLPWQLLVEDPPLPGPAEQIVLELLEDAPPVPEVIRALRRAKARGYRIALDDFVLEPAKAPLLRLADIVKLDILASGGDVPESQVHTLKAAGVELLAEKVETHEQFERCRELGFDAFQGYFLARPRTMTGRTMPASTTGRLTLLSILQSPATEPEALAKAISEDVQLSYRLLRYVNSAFFSLRRTISSVREALVLLGTDAIRRWASLLVLAGIEDQPHELVVTALVRARTCELLSRAVGGTGDEESYYTTGLFSVIDALMNARLREVLDALPLDGDICSALVDHRGPKGAALEAIKAYERGEFDHIAPELREHIGPAYLQALRHADELGAVATA